MSVKDRDILRTFLSPDDRRQNPTLTERRVRLDRPGEFLVVPEGVEVKSGKVR